MVLSSNNSGKYLTERYRRMHAEAMIDRTRFSPQELAWLEITDEQGRGRQDPETYRVENPRLDPERQTPRERDIRDDYDKG